MHGNRERQECSDAVLQYYKVRSVTSAALTNWDHPFNHEPSCLLGVYCYSVRPFLTSNLRHRSHIRLLQGSRLILNLRIAAESGTTLTTTSTPGAVKLHGLEFQSVPRSTSTQSTDVEMTGMSSVG